jgi:hypothetical protein
MLFRSLELRFVESDNPGMKARRSPARLFSVLSVLFMMMAWTGCSLSPNSSNNNPPGPGELAASSLALQFGTIPRASSKELSETISNGGSSALTVSGMSATGAGFSYTGITPPVTLSPGQAATFKVTFSPQSTGATAGNLVIDSNAANPTLSITLSGTSTSPGQLGVNPATLNFGSVAVGSSQSQTASLSASNGPVTVSAADISGSEFSVTGLSLPVTIPSGSSISFTVSFTPQASGSTTGTITFTGSASNSGIAQNLSGTGTAPAQHTVTLNWKASTSSSVVAYNVYRGTVSGGPYSQIDSVSSTTAMDSTVASGQTYFYVVTAVDSSSQESGYSNQTTAVIPFP